MKTKKDFKISGMHCGSCETLITNLVKDIDGVISTKIDYEIEEGKVTFNSRKTSIKKIFNAIEKHGYECSLKDYEKEEDESKSSSKINTKTIGIAFGIIGILIIGYFIFSFADSIAIPEISQNMGYGLLFLVGLLTGFHCVSMCGGFVVSYTAKHAQEGTKSYKSHMMYGAGKTLSYTIMGAAFGLLGSIIIFTPLMRGTVGIIAGLFLVVFGLNMLHIFPWLRKIRIKTPKFLSKFVKTEEKKHKSPLIIGLLSGLMLACGP